MRIITFLILSMLCYHLNAQNENGTDDNKNVRINIPLEQVKKDRSLNQVLYEAYYHDAHIYINNNDNCNAIVTIKEESNEYHFFHVDSNSITIIELTNCTNKEYIIEIITDDGKTYIGELIL